MEMETKVNEPLQMAADVERLEERNAVNLR